MNLRNHPVAALAESRIISESRGDEVVHLVTDEWGLIYNLELIEKAVRRITRTKNVEDLFKKVVQRNGTEMWVPSRDLARLISCFSVSADEIREVFPKHRFNPYIELFMRAGPFEDWQKLIQAKALSQRLYSALKERVVAIIEESRSPSFKKLLDDHERTTRKNRGSVMGYIDALFERYSKLLVLRIDLGYRKPLLRGTKEVVTFDEVWGHRRRFLKDLKKLIPNNALAGYVWKLEYGLSKSFHYHLLIFLDGQKVREDITIARILGEHWVKAVTNGAGLYYNCNARKSGYRSLGIGLISHNDQSLREGLALAATYLVKPDYYIRMVAPKKGRVLGKGCLPKQPKSAGRPRTKSA